MQSFDILRVSEAKKTFRVASVLSQFDLQSERIEERFVGNLDMPANWQIGLIVGRSGTGKTTIAKEIFADAYVTQYPYKSNSVLDDMPISASMPDIINAFGSVGFNSVPSWLKPYSVLSNGEKMRVDLARSILESNQIFLFDEFTSVVDRTVAQIGSYAMQKAIRKTKKQFIAVTCHFDVEDWLMPDWVLETDSMTFRVTEGQKKNRPNIKFTVYRTENKNCWKMFAKHHYLAHSHNSASHVYVAYCNDCIAAFISIMHLPHPSSKIIKKVHRLVVLPEFQGLGIGNRLLDFVGSIYKNQGYRFTIVTSSPALIYSLKKSKDWACINYGRIAGGSKSRTRNVNTGKYQSTNRITASFELKQSINSHANTT